MTTKSAEGNIDTDDMPIIAPVVVEPIVTEPVVAPVVTPIVAEPVPAAAPITLPENLETDELILFAPKPAEPEPVVKTEPVVEAPVAANAVDAPADEIFTTDLFTEAPVEVPTVTEDKFVTDFFTEAGDVFGEAKATTAKELAALVKTTVAAAKTIVEIDTTKYTAEQLALHTHLQSDKSVTEFADVAAPYLTFLSKSDDDKVRSYLVHEKGFKEADVQDEFDRLVEDDKWDDTVKEINSTIITLKNEAVAERVAKITADSVAISAKNATLTQTEQAAMVTAIDGLNEFMGMQLPDTFKTQLKAEITSGQLTKKNNNAQTQVKARLYDLVGDRIMSGFQKQLETEKESAYNRGLAAGQGSLYNKPPTTDSPGHMKPNEHSNDEKAGFRNIDEDSIQT